MSGHKISNPKLFGNSKINKPTDTLPGKANKSINYRNACVYFELRPSI